MRDRSSLREALTGLAPIHDTPLGVAHPYWARKPLNLVDAIIRSLSDEGDLVVDPFMGSGTSVFAAVRAQRRVIGGDLSPLSHFIVSATLDLVTHADLILPELRRILDEHRRITLPWFQVPGGRYVERTRYDVVGSFAHGDFELQQVEVVTAEVVGGSWSGRRPTKHEWTVDAAVLAEHLDSPVDFERLHLLENSRIAIPRGATLAHYFTPENRASINVYRQLVSESDLAPKHQAALEFPLSSALPQLRLSDRKASSQWPVWRPRTGLTSRNPSRVLGERFQRIEALATWGTENGLVAEAVSLHLTAAQDLGARIDERAQLVVTDPPYGDQVPYGEYSELWNGVLALQPPASAAGSELVRSDAPHRRTDSSDYLLRLAEAFASNAALIKPGGYLVWFYQDQDLRCWEVIAAAAKEAAVEVVDVIPVPKPRRSLKTIISPGTTLDGDLICVFRRPEDLSELSGPRSRLPDVGGGSDTDYFARYANMIANALMNGTMSELARQHGTVKRALSTKE